MADAISGRYEPPPQALRNGPQDQSVHPAEQHGFRRAGRTDIVDVIDVLSQSPDAKGAGTVSSYGGATRPALAQPTQALSEDAAQAIRGAVRVADAQRFRPNTRIDTVQPRYQVQDKREDILGQSVSVSGAEAQARNIPRGFNPYTEQSYRPFRIRTPDTVNIASEPPQSRFSNATRADDLIAPIARVTGAQSQRDNAPIGSNVYTNQLVSAQQIDKERSAQRATDQVQPDTLEASASEVYATGIHASGASNLQTQATSGDDNTPPSVINDPFAPNQRRALDDAQIERKREIEERNVDYRAAHSARLIDIRS